MKKKRQNIIQYNNRVVLFHKYLLLLDYHMSFFTIFWNDIFLKPQKALQLNRKYTQTI